MGGGAGVERLWLARLRWRMRGAWLWPTFFALVLVDAVLLVRLPPYGDDGPGDLAGAALLAGFANLFVVAALAPLAGAVLRRRAGAGLPRVVAVDRAGTALLCICALALLAAGLAHRPAVASQQEDQAAVGAALHAYVRASAPEYAAHLPAADRLRLEPERYRACVPGREPGRSLCLFVNTDQRPASVTLDPSREPNSTFRAWGGFE